MTRHAVPVDERVLGPNPFAKEDVRHAGWRDICRSAAEDEADVLTTALRRLEACPESHLSVELVNGIAAAFDVRARYLAALMVRSFDDIARFEEALPRIVDAVAALGRELCPSFLQKEQFVEQVRIRLVSRVAHWQHLALKLAREVESKNTGEATVSDAADSTKTRCSNWSEVTIEFTSDHRVQVTVPGGTNTENYADMGFEDRRTGRPNSAWEMLRTIAEGDGRVSKSRSRWTNVEKRVQEIRRALRAYFPHRKIAIPKDDPLPFVKGQGYVAAFHLRVRPSYGS